MTIVNATELQQHLATYLQRAAAGEEIRITAQGRIIARLSPEPDEAGAAAKRLEALRGTMILGDVVGPVAEMAWNADADHL